MAEATSVLTVGTSSGPLPSVDWPRVLARLPRPAWRRSWFVKQFPVEDELGIGLDYFVQLLAEVAPQKVRALAGQGGMAHYVALAQYCADLFPMNLDWILMDAGDGSIISFIPVDSLGIDPWEQTIESPVVAVCLVAYHMPADPYAGSREQEPFSPGHFDCLKRFQGQLPDMSGKLVDKAPLAPRGRRYKRPWDGLGDLFAWANGQTGYGFLDVADLEEAGYSFPEWARDEILSLAEQWRQAKPVLQRAITLRNFVEERPRERLPLLANALLGDPAALKAITAPKTKRLAEVWK